MPETRSGSAIHPQVRGTGLDAQTRCIHYGLPCDIVAIRMRCCDAWYACKDCHAALAEHEIEVWPQAEWNLCAVLCGACGGEMTIRQYLDCDSKCPFCAASFNPECRHHYGAYFDV